MSDRPQKQPPPTMPHLVVPEDLQAIYVNLVRIAHSPSELVFDFAHLLPGVSPSRVLTRIVMSPLGAKLFQKALTDNLNRYESTFGEIPVPGSKSLADFLFRPPPSPDEPGDQKEE